MGSLTSSLPAKFFNTRKALLATFWKSVFTRLINMSQKYYEKIWTNSLMNLGQLVIKDNNTSSQSFKDLDDAKEKIVNLFLRYAVISNELCEALEEIRDPLISDYVRKYYEITVSRALQLDHELSRLLAEDASNFDDELIKMMLTPFDVRLKAPGFYLRDREEIIQSRMACIEKIRKEKLNFGEPEDSETEDEEEKVEDGEDESLDSEQTAVEVEEPTTEVKFERERETVFLKKNHNIQKKIQKEYAERYESAKEHIRLLYELRLVENTEDELREWCENFYKISGVFPPFPPEDLVYITGTTYGFPTKCKKFQTLGDDDRLPKSEFARDFCGIPKLGGSALITASCWVCPQEWVKCVKVKGKEKGYPAKPQKKLPIKSIKKSTGFQMDPTEYFKIIRSLGQLNCQQDSDKYVESEAIYNVGFEIRKVVDESFKGELGLLEVALYKDKFPRRRRRKGKGRKAQKGGKKRIDKLHDATTEDCIEDLLRTGVLREGYGSRLQDFLTDFDYTGKTANGKLVDLLLQRCILPLSSLAVHQLSPLTRSICLTGPRNSGKQFLIDAVITATGSAVFDLSPHVTSSYSKKELERLIAVVKRLSRELQPSVIFIRDIEKLFYKKIPKEERRLKSTQLQSYILKLVKGITASDQILLMATSSNPWLAKRIKLIRCIDRFFYVPITHYGSHMLYWREILGDDEMVPALAKISSHQGYRHRDIHLSACTMDYLAIIPPFDGRKLEKFMKRTPQGVAKRKLLALTPAKKKNKK